MMLVRTSVGKSFYAEADHLRWSASLCIKHIYTKNTKQEYIMLKEVLVVEGKMDVVAVGKALEADCIITGGFSLQKHTLDDIAAAYKKRGIIIMTDPDSAGERIRRFLTKRFPEAKHAFVPREDATANDDIGIEQASPEAIRAALARVRTQELAPADTFSGTDLLRDGLSGSPEAGQRRDRLGAVLGLGHANAKTFLMRLNHYGVTREEYEKALQEIQ